MPEPFTVDLKPLTPVWTGDANQDPARRGSRVRETGVLGSLRWWYEALLRGLRHYACDPSQGTCIFDKDKGVSSICLACQVFGCTGFSRRFRMVVQGGGGAGQPKEIRLKSPGTNNHRGWRIPPDLMPPFRLTFLPMAAGGLDDLEKGALFYTLSLIERYGALGAKASQGQGVVRVTDWGALTSAPSLDQWKAELTNRSRNDEDANSPAPNLADFVGATITLDSGDALENRWWEKLPLADLSTFDINNTSTWLPSAPAVRAHIRTWLRDHAKLGISANDLRGNRHRLMGVVQGQNTRGSNTFVTHIYRSDAQSPCAMRIFGFVPRDGNEVDQAVRALLEDEQGLVREIQTALGGIPVQAGPYPDGVDSIMAGLKEA